MLLKDLTGQPLPPGGGRVHIQRKYDFLRATMPTDLQVFAGTSLLTPVTTGVPHLKVTSAATIGAIAEVRGSEQVDTTNLLGAGVTFEGLCFDTDVRASAPPLPQFDIQFGWRSDTGSAVDLGGFAFQLNTQATMQITGRGNGAANVNTTFPMYGSANARGTQSRDLTVLWLPRDKETIVLMGDQVIGSLKSTAHLSGVCRPFLRIINKDAASHYFRVSQITLDYYLIGAHP